MRVRMPRSSVTSTSRVCRIAFAGIALLCVLLYACRRAVGRRGSEAPRYRNAIADADPPVVISFQLIWASHGATILRSIYPNARITVDSYAMP